MSRFEVTPAAEDDLYEIADYLIEHAGVRVADRFLVELHHVFVGIASLPDAGHRRADLTSRDVRFVSSGRYLVAYDPRARPVRIVRVVHGARDAGSLFDQK